MKVNGERLVCEVLPSHKDLGFQEGCAHANAHPFIVVAPKIGLPQAAERTLTKEASRDKIRSMEFVTIHDLSRELDVSARVIRYHLTRLIAAGKLKNEEDYCKEDFKDPLHFEWKVNAGSFMRESGLKPKSLVQKFTQEFGNDSFTIGSNVVNEPITKVERPVNEPPPLVIKPASPVIEVVDQSKEINSLHREMIDTLKVQLEVKDEQIRDLTKQNRDTSELNLKLNSALLQQGGEIKNLLRLTGGKMDANEIINHDRNSVNTAANQNSSSVNKLVDERDVDESGFESAVAA